MKKLKFNGVSTEELGVVIQNTPSYSYPERDMETTHIPGRNGDIVIDNNCYKNVARQYNLAKGYFQTKGFSPNANTLVSWLTSSKGKYCRLEDDYDPEVYRLAMYNEGASITNFFDEALSAVVSFNCKPQRFLKSGEFPVKYTGNKAIINNPTAYDSLPKIKMENIPDDMRVYMLTILDKDGNETSSISFSNIDNEYFYIDSEKQNCYDNENDINEKIGLNGNDFPVLKPQENTLKIASYKDTIGSISAYKDVIQKTYEMIKSEYKTFDILVSDIQDRRMIKPYNSLINSASENYESKSYQAYAENVGEVYTFESFNTMLKNYSQQFNINADYDSAAASAYDWIDVSKSYQSGQQIVICAKHDGFFLTNKSNGKIIFVEAGKEILNTTVSSTNSITYYPTEYGQISIKYNDLPVDEFGNPTWINYDIEYDPNDNSPIKLMFVALENGYYWTDKTWFLGKAKWRYCLKGEILSTLAWDTSSKAFKNVEGLSLSSTTTYKYKFLKSDIKGKLNQYEDYYDEIADETHMVYFEVTDVSNDYDLSKIKLTATKAGYFKMVYGNNKESNVNWKKQEEDSEIATIKERKRSLYIILTMLLSMKTIRKMKIVSQNG